MRELVDYDYDEDLPEEARVWLSAFSEEHYKGWRLKAETQLHPIERLREAGADAQRRRRGECVMAFGQHRGESIDGAGEGDLREHAGTSSLLQMLSVDGANGLAPHELRSRNRTEDRMVERLDERRAQVAQDTLQRRRKGDRR
jgi:hypothetical protein